MLLSKFLLTGFKSTNYFSSFHNSQYQFLSLL